jgi:hypothetical protein
MRRFLPQHFSLIKNIAPSFFPIVSVYFFIPGENPEEGGFIMKELTFSGCRAREKVIRREVRKGGNYREVVNAVDYYPALTRKSVSELRVYLTLRIIFGIILGVGGFSVAILACCEPDATESMVPLIRGIIISLAATVIGGTGLACCSREIDRMETLLEVLEKYLNH